MNRKGQRVGVKCHKKKKRKLQTEILLSHGPITPRTGGKYIYCCFVLTNCTNYIIILVPLSHFDPRTWAQVEKYQIGGKLKKERIST